MDAQTHQAHPKCDSKTPYINFSPLYEYLSGASISGYRKCMPLFCRVNHRATYSTVSSAPHGQVTSYPKSHSLTLPALLIRILDGLTSSMAGIALEGEEGWV